MPGLETLPDRLKFYLERHPGHSQSSLSLACGKSRSYISQILNRNAQPTADAIVQICRELDITPNELLGFGGGFQITTKEEVATHIDAQAEKLLQKVFDAVNRKLDGEERRPSIEHVLQWWRRNNGRLFDYDEISERVDLMLPPDTAAPRVIPTKIGPRSLAGVTLETDEVTKVQAFLDSLPKQKYEEIVGEYVAAKDAVHLSSQSVEVDTGPGKAKLHLEYAKLLLPVQDAVGNKYILNYCVPSSDAT